MVEGQHMEVIRARFRTDEAFLAAYQPQFLNGGIFIATRTPLPVGLPIAVDVRFPALKSKVLICGCVAWRRTGRRAQDGNLPGKRARAGVGIEYLPKERATRDFLLGVARGENVDLALRKHRRLPVSVRGTWRSREAGPHYEVVVEDIAEGGAFIRTRDLSPVGSRVLVEVRPSGSQVPVVLEGRVTRTSLIPGSEGMGVEFRCRDSGGLRRLREVIRRLGENEKRSAG
jgi:Tfp pilus assembly protein PilZ